MLLDSGCSLEHRFEPTPEPEPERQVVYVASAHDVPSDCADGTVFAVKGAAAQGSRAHAKHRVQRRAAASATAFASGCVSFGGRTVAAALLILCACSAVSFPAQAAAQLAFPQPQPITANAPLCGTAYTTEAVDASSAGDPASRGTVLADPTTFTALMLIGVLGLLHAVIAVAASDVCNRFAVRVLQPARHLVLAVYAVSACATVAVTVARILVTILLVAARGTARLAGAIGPVAVAFLALYSTGLVDLGVSAQPAIFVPAAASPSTTFGAGSTGDLYLVYARNANIGEQCVGTLAGATPHRPSLRERYGLADTGASEDCLTEPLAFPTISGVSSLLPCPSNVLICGAEGKTSPPDGCGAAQVVVQDDQLNDYIYYSPRAWCTTSFNQSLISEGGLWTHASAVTVFAGVQRIYFPGATVPLKKKAGVYRINYKLVCETPYSPVPHGAAVGGLYRPKVGQLPRPPDISSGLACAVGVTRGRGTRTDMRDDHPRMHCRTHASPRVLSHWYEVADGVGMLPETLAQICDACICADGDSHAHTGKRPETTHEGTWDMDILGPLPTSVHGNYNYFIVASNPRTKVVWGMPAKSRAETSTAVQRLEAWARAKGMQFHHCNFDDAKENKSQEVISFLEGKCASLSLGCGYEHTGNAGCERTIKTLSRRGRAFMIQGNVSDIINLAWPYALTQAWQVGNTLPTRIDDAWWSPEQYACRNTTACKPDVSQFRAPFCDARILLQGLARQSKMHPKRVHAMFVGKDPNGMHQGWTFLTHGRQEPAYSHEAHFYEHCSGWKGIDPFRAPVILSPSLSPSAAAGPTTAELPIEPHIALGDPPTARAPSSRLRSEPQRLDPSPQAPPSATAEEANCRDAGKLASNTPFTRGWHPCWCHPICGRKRIAWRTADSDGRSRS